ncbi:MAG: outer membrane protein assembly factor BamD [Cucumibacter sp.]
MLSRTEGIFARPAPAVRLLAAVLLALTLTACSGFGLFGERKIVEEEIIPAEDLYNEAIGYIEQGRAKSALETFQKLERQHPYSEYAEKTRLLTVFVQFGAGQFDEAILAADRYLALYPSAQDAPYAMYMKGTSYFRQIKDLTRDQGTAQDAISTYERLIENYPDTDYAQQARENILIAHDQLAGKEMSVGRYYLGNRQYTAALNRFKVVVEDYETSTHVEEALERLVECYLALGLVREAQHAAAILGHNYPSSQWYQDAYTLLQSQGLAPQAQDGNALGSTLSG